MSTTCTFKGIAFQGIVTDSSEGEFLGRVDRSGVSGLNGEDEILMGSSGLPIDVKVWLFGFADDAALINYVATVLQPLLNTNGLLAISGGITRSYSETTLDSFEPVDRPTTQDHDATLKRVQTWRFKFRCLNP